MRLTKIVMAGVLGAILLAGLCAGSAAASSQSLKISLPDEMTVRLAFRITVTGVADGRHRLYIYADEERRSQCAPTPSDEWARGTFLLTDAEGDALPAGSFTNTFALTAYWQLPTFCGYLDEARFDTPDVIAKEAEPLQEYLEEEEPAQPTGEYYGTSPGALEPLPVNPQIEKEYWERVERERDERANRQRAQASAEAPSATPSCSVPGLRGRSVKAARRLLRAHHCKLGRVTIARGHHDATVVVHQSRKSGTRLFDGAPVAVTLG